MVDDPNRVKCNSPSWLGILNCHLTWAVSILLVHMVNIGNMDRPRQDVWRRQAYYVAGSWNNFQTCQAGWSLRNPFVRYPISGDPQNWGDISYSYPMIMGISWVSPGFSYPFWVSRWCPHLEEMREENCGRSRSVEEPWRWSVGMGFDETGERSGCQVVNHGKLVDLNQWEKPG